MSTNVEGQFVSPNDAKPLVSRRTFEYRIIDHDMFDEGDTALINTMGSKGWEIIKILDPIKWLNSDGMFTRIYYKREKLS